jgi:hypothetical protein
MKIQSIVLSALLTSTLIAGCNVETSDGAGGGLTPTPGVTLPCSGAVLHSRQDYSACSNGFVTNMEEDNWCCPDGTMPTTDSPVSSTDVACSGTESSASGGDQMAVTMSDAGASSGGTIAAGAALSCCAPATSNLAAAACPGGQCCLPLAAIQCVAAGGIFQASCSENPPSC